MPTGGRKPRSASLGEVLEGLLEAGVDFILVGGLAAVIQGAPVTTMDVDIVHSQSAENISRLLAFLKSVEAVHRRLDDKLIEPKERDLSGKGHVLLTTRIGPLDILGAIEGGKSYEELLEHTIEIDFRGHRLRVPKDVNRTQEDFDRSQRQATASCAQRNSAAVGGEICPRGRQRRQRQ